MLLGIIIGIVIGANMGYIIFALLFMSKISDNKMGISKKGNEVNSTCIVNQMCVNCPWYAIEGEKACEDCGKCTFDE